MQNALQALLLSPCTVSRSPWVSNGILFHSITSCNLGWLIATNPLWEAQMDIASVKHFQSHRVTVHNQSPELRAQSYAQKLISGMKTVHVNHDLTICRLPSWTQPSNHLLQSSRDLTNVLHFLSAYSIKQQQDTNTWQALNCFWSWIRHVVPAQNIPAVLHGW